MIARLLAVSVALAFCACASVGIGPRIDFAPETAYGIEATATGREVGVFRLAAQHVEGSTWGPSRTLIRPALGVQPFTWFEAGAAVHIVPDWHTGTWAELVPYMRITWRGLSLELNHEASNASDDKPGDHPRRPGLGYAFVFT